MYMISLRQGGFFQIVMSFFIFELQKKKEKLKAFNLENKVNNKEIL